MKKVATWVAVIAFIIFVLDWGVIGLKLLDGNYDILGGAYIGLACLIAIIGCAVYKVFSNKCPYCGKMLHSTGKYCPHCGKSIEK